MKLFDLTLTLEPGLPCFAAWHASCDIESRGTLADVGRNTKKISFGSHAGTHIDAPLHFFDDGYSVDQIDINLLYGNVKVVDFRGLATQKEAYALTPSDFIESDIQERMMFLFGWNKYWKTEHYYKDYPYFSVDAAYYLINHGMKLLLIDTPTPDNSRAVLHSDEDSVIHKAFLSQGIIMVEYLKTPEDIDIDAKHTVAALPLKIAGSDGSPARVILIEE
ncbi:MAG: cyclase family protein [Peptococcaceae bacterium]|nr:cyclase family protein [Peptococcaceae bacterium]